MKTELIKNITYKKINEISSEIKKSKVVILPTETVYGICANAYDDVAINKIYDIKQRDKSKSLIVLISNIDMLKTIVEELNEIEKSLIKKYWPGPLTLILNKSKNSKLSKYVSNNDTVAIRLTSNKLISNIIEKSGVPLVAPSANISGCVTGTKIKDIIDTFNDKVDYIVDAGDIIDDTTSTIIQVIDNKVNVIREGKIKIM